MSSGHDSHAVGNPEGVLVVIVAHNESHELQACLEQLLADPGNKGLPVTVVDNASRDDTVDMLRRLFPKVRIIKNKTNRGYGPAVNQGLRSHSSRYVLVLNPDVRAHPGAIPSLVGFMNANPDTALVGPRLLNPDGSLQFSARRFYTLKTLLLRRTPLGRIFPNHTILRDHLMADWGHEEARDVDWVLGGCMMVRTRFLDHCGGFDERYFLYLEDTDVCRTAWREGKRVQYFPEAIFTHSHRQASRNGLREMGAWFHHLASGLKYYLKWNDGWKKLIVFRCLLLVLLDLLFTMAGFWAAWKLRLHLPPLLSSPMPAPEVHAALVFPGLTIWMASLICSRAYVLKESGRGVVPWARVLLAGVLAGTATTALLFFSGFYRSGFPFSRMIISSALSFAVIGALLCRLSVATIVGMLWRYGYARKQTLLLALDSELIGRLRKALRHPSRDLYSFQTRGENAHSLARGAIVKDRAEVNELLGTQEFIPSQHFSLVLAFVKQGADVLWLEPRPSLPLPFRICDFHGMPAYRFRGVGWSTLLSRLAKRLVDILVAGVGLIVTSPLLAWLVVLVKLEDGGPAFFIQPRVGRFGRTFRMFKLRTMTASRIREPAQLNNVAQGPLVRVESDPRVTRVGHFLRRHKLDELPQFLNVLKGEMSIAGPRPPISEEVAQYEEWQKLRLEALPGITGLWQVDKDRQWKFDEMVALDIKYILEWSFVLDLTILAGTIPAMLEGR